jgi:hypothetical protein
MPGPTLLNVVHDRFGVVVDPDSDGGQILNSLTPKPPFDDQSMGGEADVAPLTFTPTGGGVSVRAAQANDALVFSLPVGSITFTLVPPDAQHPAPQVELKLLSLTVPVPFLRPAQANPDGTLQEMGGKVELHFPDLLLVVTASAAPPAAARLAPSHDAAGAQEVTMTPPAALIGPGTVLGIGFERAMLKLDGPGEAEIAAPEVEIYVAPPGIPALAMHGGGHDLRLGLGTSGLSGDFAIALADGAQAAARPRFLHNLAAHLRLNHSAIILLELTGQIDVPGEVNARLDGALSDPPAEIDYTLSLKLDNGWQASLALSVSGGRHYLWRTQRPAPDPDAHDLPRDTLGAYAVFTPLLMPALPGAGSSGYVDLALGAGAAAGLAASQSVSTQSITLYGGELRVRQPAGGAPEGFLFFDLETELHVKVHLGATKLLATRRPLKVRHKAIGLRLDFGPGGDTPQLKPVFDPSQGFSLDLSDPGMFDVPPPLGDILQPDAARMARENPLMLEVDLITKVDLGVVTIDRAGVRIPLDAPALPSLTALGAHLNAGAISGSGYLKFLPNGGLAGRLDASLGPLGVRAAATLGLGKAHDDATGEDLAALMAGFDVEWPVPVPLANSGLGLFGVLGLFAMHMTRNQPPEQDTLDWFINVAHGNVNDANAAAVWRPTAHRWAFGAGAVIGTVEGGFLIHAKGMLVLELPGPPRLLLVMNADILSERPGKEGPDTGTLLAVIDIKPNSLTIGVLLDYHPLRPLLEVRVPAEAHFDFDQPENWYLDVGGIPPKMTASVKVLFSFRADGYLLIHGNGIPDFPIGPLAGFAVAAGIRAAFIWGPEAIGLYLKIAAQADVGVSFKPFLVIGKLTLSGELHLFIVSIGASASAEVILTPSSYFISAEVCGEVDFFFFSVEGCVKLELGDRPKDLPPAEAMIRALSLHSRPPALLPASGADQPVDGSLGDAFHLDPASGQFVPVTPGASMPVVPVDAIPVLQFEMRPAVDTGTQFFNQAIPSLLAPDPANLDLDASKLPASAWVRRGRRFYHYRLKSLTLSGTKADGSPLASLVDEGDTPVAWWDRHGKPSQGDDNDVQLALLSWLPDPTPAAAERTIARENAVKERWGDVCAQVAGPAGVLWSWHQAAVGPSALGWWLYGEVWPDPPGTQRSSPPDPWLHVTEPWRSGDPLADSLADVDPAYVMGTSVLPERLLIGPRTGRELLPRLRDDAQFASLFQALHPQPLGALPAAVRLDTRGLRHVGVLLFIQRQSWAQGLMMLRALGADGAGTGMQVGLDPGSSREIHSTNDLPREWGDPASPWFPTVRAVLNAWFQVYVRLLGEPALVFFEADLPAGSAQIELGLRDELESHTPHWGLLLAAGLTEAEFARFSFDELNRKNRIDVVNGALGRDESKRALLRPDALYTIRATYDVAVADANDQGQPDTSKATVEKDHAQSFQFCTQANPPERLDPWVLATDPAAAEDFFFYADPITIVFATNATRELFAAYGRQLFAIVKAASGKHPPAANGFDPFRVSLAETQLQAQSIGGIAFTPFESALREIVANQPCIDAVQDTTQHELIKLKMQLDPLTNYILDLEAQPTAADPSFPMFRRSFNTSRYADFKAMATDVRTAPLGQRRLANLAPLAALAARNPGAAVLAVADRDLEEALRAARWGDLARPAGPRVTVIWQDGAGGAPPQPFALLLETPESAWRTRGVPALVGDPDAVKRYRLQPQAWLDVVETPAGAALAARIVRSTDGSRTLVVLQPGARGATLSLALRRTNHRLFENNSNNDTAPLVAASLAAAPWEETS